MNTRRFHFGSGAGAAPVSGVASGLAMGAL